jgi:hypothetical protein
MDRNDIRSVRAQGRCLAAAIVIAFTLLGAQARSWAAGGDELVTAPAARVERLASAPSETGAAPGPVSMNQRYAARETTSRGLETFKGGDVVIIGSGGLVIVLLIVLIIVVS